MKKVDDSVLIQKIRAGDKQALGDIIDRYLPQLTAFFRYLRAPESNLEDLVQDTFIRMMAKLDLFENDKKFSTWLLTLAKNLFIDQCRKESRRSEIRKELFVDNSPVVSVEDEVVGKYTAEELLKNLTSDERLLVELRVFQGVPFSEISELTGEMETTLRSRFFRILSRLRVKKNI